MLLMVVMQVWFLRSELANKFLIVV